MFRTREQVQQRLIAARFAPAPDITTYELAVIFQNLPYGNGRASNSVNFTPGEWAELPADLKRHFQTA